MHEFKVPKMGMSVETVEIMAWHVQAGDAVEPGSPLVDLESEKAEVTLASEVAGTVSAILVPAGEEVPVGTVLCRIETG